MNLELSIHELFLDEPWRDQRDTLAEALSAQLARLAAEAGEPLGRDSLHIEHLVIDVPADAPGELAAQVAAEIWNRMRGARR